jgi:hypothetical protein
MRASPPLHPPAPATLCLAGSEAVRVAGTSNFRKVAVAFAVQVQLIAPHRREAYLAELTVEAKPGRTPHQVPLPECVGYAGAEAAELQVTHFAPARLLLLRGQRAETAAIALFC